MESAVPYGRALPCSKYPALRSRHTYPLLNTWLGQPECPRLRSLVTVRAADHDDALPLQPLPCISSTFQGIFLLRDYLKCLPRDNAPLHQSEQFVYSLLSARRVAENPLPDPGAYVQEDVLR